MPPPTELPVTAPPNGNSSNSVNNVQYVPGMRRKKTVKILEIGVILCWVLTTSSGCFGFYLGFDTKDGDSKELVCKRDGDQCAAVGSHEAVCNACHRTRFDFVLVVISFYQVLLGLIGLLVSCGSQVVMDRFGFLRNRFGRGFFLFFIGTLGIAQGLNFMYTEYLTLVVGCIDALVGFSLMFSYVCVSSGRVYEPSIGAGAVAVGDVENRPALQDAKEALVTIAPR